MKSLYFAIVGVLFFIASPFITSAQTAPSLGNAQSFALLANSSINSSGSTQIDGNVGISPGTNISYSGNPTLNGQVYLGSSTSAGPAQASALAAYNNLAAQTTTTNLTGKTLGQSTGATTLTPGVYSFTQGAQITGTLTLNDGGKANAVFIFKITGNLNASNFAKVVMSSGGNGANVFWQVTQGVTLNSYVTFCGNLLAASNINLGVGTTSTGRYFSLGGGLTLNTNTASASALQIIDTDGDGIADALDDYPNDATRAFNNYSVASTIAFEDQWPLKGDFDMNDMVVKYSYNVITNAQNVVVHVTGSFSVLASGTTNGDGFGVQFPIPIASAKNVTGGTLEAGQTNAVITLFKDIRTLTTIWNTIPGATKVNPINYTVDFDVASGPTLSTFGTDYNPFIYLIVNNTSRHEVHLPGKTPTTLADKTLLGTGDDASNTTTGTYYVTKTGLPFAITIPATFNYPIEKTDINLAYPHFGDWALSGGLSFLDWYSNLGSGYRNTSLIFQ